MTPTPTQARPREGEMLERVERAIRSAIAAEFGTIHCNGSLGAARAAVEAMRQPDDKSLCAAMWAQGAKATNPNQSLALKNNAETVWTAMIDQILSDTNHLAAHNTSEERG